MKRLALLAVAGLLAALAPAAYAVPAPKGLTCGMVTEHDPALPRYTFFGALFGGPVTLTDNQNPAIVYSGSVTCSVQINQSTHAGVDECTATGPTTGNVAALPPTLCNYRISAGDIVYLCTHVNILNGLPRYYDAPSGSWSGNATSAGCEPAVEFLCDTGTTTPCDVKPSLLDALLCPILALFFPPEGDVGIFWDCPPYSDGRPRVSSGVHAVVPDVVV